MLLRTIALSEYITSGNIDDANDMRPHKASNLNCAVKNMQRNSFCGNIKHLL